MSVYVDKLFGIFGRQSASNSSSVQSRSDKSTTHSGTTTGGSLDQEPVMVWEATNQLEAEIIIGRLKSEGIPAIMKGEALSSIYGLNYGGMSNTTVLVPAPLAEKAIALLEAEYTIDDGDNLFDSSIDTENS